MNAEELRAAQAPLKERYLEKPAAGLITLRAEGRVGEGTRHSPPADGTLLRCLPDIGAPACPCGHA